ncbi:glycine cleavage system aminomethyltransferase GcvT [Janibacter cremeus]|uniref:aminomethyltransferase n=1 Tax=Janibacter cremeus TaxID=1285192 RepID=A0A852VN22_9MICO|nr:glycine cleavage system aminomethyltransferase GcvT [Janibacter cremeus]NYF96850.1 aminomethyltransferase [Janibacter cremeus]
MSESSALRTSPIHDRHVALNAKIADFGGWEMPIEYPGGGVVAEHAAVRERVGLFDVSHLGKVFIRGEGAAELVNTTLTNDLTRIGPGQAQYTMCCNDSGGVIDDLIVYLRGVGDLFLMPNAANSATVVDKLRAEAPEGVEVEDHHDDFVVLAVQGPRSDEVLTALDLPVDHDFMSYDTARWRDHELTICRTGYTGERGYELVAPAAAGLELWDALVEAMAPYEGLPCGLGSRDTLRTEMGYPLHGNDLGPQITPVMARAAWAVGWDKERFWGKDALVSQRVAKSSRLLRGAKVTGRGIPRPGCAVRDSEGTEVGVVTSGTFSPTLKQGIALILVDRVVTWDDEIVIDVRGRDVAATVTKPPFVEVQVKS